MSTAVPKNISRTKRELEDSSFSIQQILDPHEVVDKYLDLLSADINRIQEIVPLIIDIIEGLQDLTWQDAKPNEKTLKALNSLLDMSRGTTQKLNNFKNRILTKDFREKCPDATELLESNILIIEETIDDVHAIFFRLPNNSAFKDVCDKFSLLDN
ncbi:hypothetical protein [Algoriphagus persicinus]|uniref:hypothetical protein n=1 Tax=Algoriphagus persicinus TaxID=3108754 RepID=UPI002B3B667A|nr:hypothetical protein [Algoriphagus sp. E1-3-M2]MEB2784683.1 hypothetical protein [Algoriphagus sp. E1-3-M2]